MSLEMSAFMEEVESLHTQGMEVTGPHVSPLPTTPICEVTPNQVTRNIKKLAPKPQGKKLIVKVIILSYLKYSKMAFNHQ